MDRKLGAVSPFWGELGSRKWPGPTPTSTPSAILIHPAVWPQYTWAENWGLRPLFEEGRGPCLTQSPGPRPTSIPGGILIQPAIWPRQIWAENCGDVLLLGRGSWVAVYHNVARAEAYMHAKFHLNPSNRLATVHQRDREDRQTEQTDNGLIA